MKIPGKKQIIPFILCALLFASALSPVRSAGSALTLAWDPNTEDDLAGYKIYYGTQSGDYDSVIDVGDTTQYMVPGLDPETQYYFALTAYDTSSNESDFSAEVSAVTDPPHCVISGLGETSSGYIEAFAEDYSHGNWLRVGWKSYNSANGEARIATGDIDGDGRDEIVIGLGPVWEQPYPSGYFEVFDDDFTHLTWCRIQWKTYNNTNGESRPSCGDVDGDGYDEIIIGLGRGGGGYFEIFDYDAGSVTHKDWGRVNWKSYNKSSGKTRAACGNIDNDVYDEIIIGLDWGGGGYFEIFDYDADSITHKDWGVVQWLEYNITNGETRPACGDIDGDGLDEIVIGLGQGADGYLEIFDDAVAGCGHVAWPRVHWKSYNSTNGETWPALKK